MNITAVEKEPPMVSKPLKYINRFVIFCQLFILGGLATIVTSRQRFEEIGQDIYESSGHLMGSFLADVFVRTEMLAPLSIIFIYMIYKERKTSPIKTKIMINLICLGITVLFTSVLISKLYPI